ncbi:RIP metalloprotease RseP [Marinigracilibium pacificum]|uniref:Zinc metalloprotease n=1 Tax=Marinigracilibium pacificum TaxID=2729599 RepID=A0A848IYA4_9BACT|nr:RIP metalloprotease RseP [Marinigracilibium pacificum]NMM49483.1 RIP metalloprotease RseP [Marinigracilibium pacificum]
MEGIIMFAQLILSISILVGLHELGHLVAAKVFGMRVEKYSIGFPPKIFGFQWGETEYSIGAIPLGGFVKISGMVDESLDTENLSEEPQPWEFRAKPAWQRLIVMLGGIIINVITGVIIFISLLYVNGEEYLPKSEVNKAGIYALELGEKIGLKTGDKIIDVNGRDWDKFSDLRDVKVLLEDNSYYTVLRGTDTIKVDIPSDFMNDLSEKKEHFIFYRHQFVVGDVAKDSPGDKAGLKAGDKILALNGKKFTYFDEFKTDIENYKGETVALTVDREGNTENLNVALGDSAIIGFKPMIDGINFEKLDYTLAEAIPKGTAKAFTVVWVNIQAFGKMFSGDLDPTKSLQGPIGIMRTFGGTWDWTRFWALTGLLSMVLAFMNLLPIPALDGGHVVFLLYEMVSGRKPSDKFLEGAQKVGMAILLTLMVFIFGNDIWQWIRDSFLG